MDGAALKCQMADKCKFVRLPEVVEKKKFKGYQPISRRYYIKLKMFLFLPGISALIG